MTIRVEENIFGFQVSVDDALGVQVADGTGDLCSVKPRSRFREETLFGEVEEELRSKIKDK